MCQVVVLHRCLVDIATLDYGPDVDHMYMPLGLTMKLREVSRPNVLSIIGKKVRSKSTLMVRIGGSQIYFSSNLLSVILIYTVLISCPCFAAEGTVVSNESEFIFTYLSYNNYSYN